jgi:hypothetical protein
MLCVTIIKLQICIEPEKKAIEFMGYLRQVYVMKFDDVNRNGLQFSRNSHLYLVNCCSGLGVVARSREISLSENDKHGDTSSVIFLISLLPSS